jgi:hypothetical protein
MSHEANLKMNPNDIQVGKLTFDASTITSAAESPRRHDDVNPGAARHRRQVRHGGLDLLAGDRYQVGHFIDDDDEGQQVKRQFLFREN